jgi:hypothetical protein
LDANRYLASAGGNRLAGQCAGKALTAWARADAVSVTQGLTAKFKLATTLSGLALAYLQVKPVVPIADRAIIEAWLTRRSADVRAAFADQVYAATGRNNQSYWAALAVTAVAVAVQDPEDFNWGMKTFNRAVCSIDADGALPEEMKRGPASLHYQAYALNPLFALAEFAQANGSDAYGLCKGGLLRAGAFTVREASDPVLIAVKAQVRQSPVMGVGGHVSRSLFSWLAIYSAHRPLQADWARSLAADRLAIAEAGGDQALLFGTRGKD